MVSTMVPVPVLPESAATGQKQEQSTGALYNKDEYGVIDTDQRVIDTDQLQGPPRVTSPEDLPSSKKSVDSKNAASS